MFTWVQISRLKLRPEIDFTSCFVVVDKDEVRMMRVKEVEVRHSRFLLIFSNIRHRKIRLYTQTHVNFVSQLIISVAYNIRGLCSTCTLGLCNNNYVNNTTKLIKTGLIYLAWTTSNNATRRYGRRYVSISRTNSIRSTVLMQLTSVTNSWNYCACMQCVSL